MYGVPAGIGRGLAFASSFCGEAVLGNRESDPPSGSREDISERVDLLLLMVERTSQEVIHIGFSVFLVLALHGESLSAVGA